MATPHNSAERGDIAKVVLMPGDPLRAKVVAERYLENVVCFNQVRNMLGYTGYYKGYRISVMGSGMGMPSIAIYSYELYTFFGVNAIIRIGSAGGISKNVNVRDIIIAEGACTDSNFAYQYNVPGAIAPIADFGLMRKAVDLCEERGAHYHVGNLLSSDVFYNAFDYIKSWSEMGVLAVEMETAALYLNAMHARKKALGIMTVSDHLITDEQLSAEARQNTFTEMMEIALGVAMTEA